MNVFVLDKSMEKSAQMLDDVHLKAQINEGCQVLMANYNKVWHAEAKIGHISHPVTKFYSGDFESEELLAYIFSLCEEYRFRFKKEHQNVFWAMGFKYVFFPVYKNIGDEKTFSHSKTYVNGIMTDDIAAIRHYIMTKPQQKKPVWTNREKPEWWEV